jgi:hypothetical protein
VASEIVRTLHVSHFDILQNQYYFPVNLEQSRLENWIFVLLLVT